MQPSSAPSSGTSIAISPMRPSRKRVASAEHESDTEPGGAGPGEWEKRCSITESNLEGEAKDCGEGKEDQQARRAANGEKPWVSSLQPLRKKNRVASSSLTLTGRLKAKAVRESPRVRKVGGRVVVVAAAARGGGGRRRLGIKAAPEDSRGRHVMLDACSFPESAGASTKTGVGMGEGKGSDRASSGETTGPGMPYNGENVSFLFPRLGWKCGYLKSDEIAFNYALGIL